MHFLLYSLRGMESMPENDDIQIEKQRLKYHHSSYGYKISKRISLGRFLKNVFWDLGEFPFWGIVCFIIGYVFICAHGQYWSLPLASCCIVLLLLCMSVQRLYSKRRNLFECEYPWQLLILAIPLAWSFVQLLPCGELTRCLSPESHKIWQDASEVIGSQFISRISISPNQTIDFCEGHLL